MEPIERFDLTFSGGASFQGPHGGQTIYVALVRKGIVSLRIIETAVVSATADPSFSFNFPGRLIKGEEYDLDYWIDSNFGGGTPETCDPPGNDHQWHIDIGLVTDDVVIEDTHRPTETGIGVRDLLIDREHVRSPDRARQHYPEQDLVPIPHERELVILGRDILVQNFFEELRQVVPE